MGRSLPLLEAALMGGLWVLPSISGGGAMEAGREEEEEQNSLGRDHPHPCARGPVNAGPRGAGVVTLSSARSWGNIILGRREQKQKETI